MLGIELGLLRLRLGTMGGGVGEGNYEEGLRRGEDGGLIKGKSEDLRAEIKRLQEQNHKIQKQNEEIRQQNEKAVGLLQGQSLPLAPVSVPKKPQVAEQPAMVTMSFVSGAALMKLSENGNDAGAGDDTEPNTDIEDDGETTKAVFRNTE